MAVFRLFAKLRYSNERSTKFESLYHEQKYLGEENGKMVALQIPPKQRLCMDWVDRPQNDKGLYGILQLLQGSHLDNFPLKTLKFGWVAFHSVTFQLNCCLPTVSVSDPADCLRRISTHQDTRIGSLMEAALFEYYFNSLKLFKFLC